MTPDDRQLLLYIASKVARLDAISSAIHAILYKDLMPTDPKAAEKRNWLVRQLYTENIRAEKEHFKTQFPDEYPVMAEYIALGEQEMNNVAVQALLDLLEGRTELPEAFREPPPEEPPPKGPD